MQHHGASTEEGGGVNLFERLRSQRSLRKEKKRAREKIKTGVGGGGRSQKKLEKRLLIKGGREKNCDGVGQRCSQHVSPASKGKAYESDWIGGGVTCCLRFAKRQTEVSFVREKRDSRNGQNCKRRKDRRGPRKHAAKKGDRSAPVDSEQKICEPFQLSKS